MRIKLVEEYKQYLNEDIVKKFEAAVDSGDYGQIIKNAITILSDVKNFFDQEENPVQLRRINKLISRLRNLSVVSNNTIEDDLDRLLDQAYDFLDDNRIIIDKTEFH